MKWSIFACRLSVICLLCWQVGSPWPERGPGASIWRGSYYYQFYEYRSELSRIQAMMIFRTDQGVMDYWMVQEWIKRWWKHFVVNFLLPWRRDSWRNGALRNNISIDIIMPTSQMQIFLPSKKAKANINISYETPFQIWLCLAPALSRCLCFHLCLSWLRSVGGEGTWPGLAWVETNIAL